MNLAFAIKKELPVPMLNLNRAKYLFSCLTNGWIRAGAQVTLQWLRFLSARKLSLGQPALWHVHPRQVQHDLAVRLRGSSDIDVLCQIFLDEEYYPLRSLQDVSSILDLGANVGFASAYFLSCFPKSRILSVEPDDGNVEMCRANLRPYGERALIIRGAVWSENSKLSLVRGSFGDGREWATQVSVPSHGDLGEVDAWDVGSLIDRSGFDCIDLLKVDIEGAELAVFSESSPKWLQRVHNICIELHGGDCSTSFFNALSDFDYELEHSGELTICKNIHLQKHPLSPTCDQQPVG